MNLQIREYARELRKNMPEPEKRLWFSVLSSKQTGYKFLRQHPIGKYIPDFYCRKLQLIIEVDGDSHADQIEYDEKRTAFFSSQGITVLRFWNTDVIENIDGVVFQIMSWIENWEKENQ